MSEPALVMLLTAIILFALAAILGLTVAVQILKKKPTSKAVAVVHGLFAAVALIVLIVQAIHSPAKLLTTAIVLFVVAALGGLVAFINDLRQKPGPAGLIVIHALVAVIGVILVLVVLIR